MLNVINFYSGPGCGKSTSAAGLFFRMKSEGYSVELVTEYAKDKAYEGHLSCLEDQIYIFGKQQRRLNRLIRHVEYAITDSPLLLSILYNKDLSVSFNNLILEQYGKYNNFNFFLNRVKEYVKIGRTQSYKEACLLDVEMYKLLLNYNIPFSHIDGDSNAPDKILKAIKGTYDFSRV